LNSSKSGENLWKSLNWLKHSLKICQKYLFFQFFTEKIMPRFKRWFKTLLKSLLKKEENSIKNGKLNLEKHQKSLELLFEKSLDTLLRVF